VLALYQGAGLFVYPSFYEGWGLQVHEAMIAGVPVTVANNSTMPEIAGDAADTCDPYDAADMSRSMERILTGTALRETLVARGLARVKRYSWREAAERVASGEHGIAFEREVQAWLEALTSETASILSPLREALDEYVVPLLAQGEVRAARLRSRPRARRAPVAEPAPRRWSRA
jgi:hypothetical protein